MMKIIKAITTTADHVVVDTGAPMKRTFTAITIFSLGFVLWACSHQTPQETSPSTSQQPTSAVAPATLAQQKMCSDQADKSFKEFFSDSKSTYTTHFDPTFGVCCMETTTRDMLLGTRQYSHRIYDAFENRTYGTFTSFSNEGKPQECSIKPRGRAEITCTSNDEFDDLALQYFGTVPD